MLFSSLVFLWYFLPICAALYYLLRRRQYAANLLLLAASLFFYAWGEPKYILLMAVSIALNYACGLAVSRFRTKEILAVCVLANLAILGYFKYFNFLAELVNRLLPGQPVALRDIALPIGISFYTFQALSYVIDVYRGEIRVQRDPLKLALYISFFPQLIAGPIVQYHDVSEQLEHRRLSWTKTACGIKRFTYGLGKKVIFANAFAAVVDRVLGGAGQPLTAASQALGGAGQPLTAASQALGGASQPLAAVGQALGGATHPLIGTGLAWFVILLYALQIYYDFSGYSDMAIGLGKIFGFDFQENFRYPYLSGSVREFWRRWHISLSTWFKQYVYIPLGGNRRGQARTYVNLFIVFLATGLWHGASLNFVLWGIYYGIFLVMERAFLGKWLEKNPLPVLNHIYTLAVILIGWSLFRVEDMRELFRLWQVMFSGSHGVLRISMFADKRVWTLLLLGIAFCGPVQRFCPKIREALYREDAVSPADMAVMAAILTVCTVLLVCNTYNPFIYFRF